MKKFIILSLTALLCLCLCACGEVPAENRVLVSVVETGEITVDDNGKWIEPGKNTSFILHLPDGLALTGSDYDGIYTVEQNGNLAKLTLRNVQFPTHVNLATTNYFRSITYEPNGCDGASQSVTYDVSIHTRPNTSIGTDLFRRDGYTLFSWNTEADGGGARVGLGSRVTVPQEGLTLYAQWVEWTAPENFSYRLNADGVTITRYLGQAAEIVIPEAIGGRPVTTLASGAFSGSTLRSVILPNTLVCIEDGAFDRCALESLTLFDNLEDFGDAGFSNCPALQTLYINAIEAPYGTLYRRESVYADKVDLLIQAQGRPKLVFYGGCSTWYNLNGSMAQRQLGSRYTVINMGLNGTASSLVQMEILSAFLEEGDILFHTPELCSIQQLLTYRDMSASDDKLWCGLEYNYDLFTLVDLRGMHGVFDSLRSYLGKKDQAGDYRQQYTDNYGQTYTDATGSIPFERTLQAPELIDKVLLDPGYLQEDRLSLLRTFYERYAEQGVRVYVSYAGVNLDAVPEEQRDNVSLIDTLFRAFIAKTEGAVLISHLADYLFENKDFYDTNYHMLSDAADRNTALWLRDLEAAFDEK